MTPNRRPIDKDTLGAIIDIHGLIPVLEMLAEVCHEKAEQVDEVLARRWRDVSIQLGRISTGLPRRSRVLRTSA
jgi:hypothetical protein